MILNVTVDTNFFSSLAKDAKMFVIVIKKVVVSHVSGFIE